MERRPRRRSESTATSIMSAPAASSRILITGHARAYPARCRDRRSRRRLDRREHRAARLQAHRREADRRQATSISTMSAASPSCSADRRHASWPRRRASMPSKPASLDTRATRKSGLHQPFPAAKVGPVLSRRPARPARRPLSLTAIATPGHTPGARAGTGARARASAAVDIVYADSVTACQPDDYRFSRPSRLSRRLPRSIAGSRRLRCDILITPHPARKQAARPARRQGAADRPGQCCKAYADDGAKGLDERLAQGSRRK